MNTIYGIYAGPDDAQRAVDVLAAAETDLHIRKQQIVVISAEPFDGYDFSDEHADTHLFRLALLGAAIGGTFGYWLTSFTQKAYVIPTGGMPIVPPWTNGIIIYELTMLGAIICTIITLLASARLPRLRSPLTDAAMWEGKILVGVADAPAGSRNLVAARLFSAGAMQVKEFVAGKGSAELPR